MKGLIRQRMEVDVKQETKGWLRQRMDHGSYNGKTDMEYKGMELGVEGILFQDSNVWF